MNEIIKKKEDAIKKFKEMVLESEFKESIAKIVLFGSVLKKDAHEDSDIDLLILSTDGRKKIENFLSDISWNIWWKTGERIESLIFPLSEIRYPSSWVVYRALKIGKEVYSMKEEEIKRKEQNEYSQLSRHYLGGASRNLREGDYRLAVDSAYNASELAVKGLLLFKLDDLPSSHGGIVNRFGALFVKTGEIKSELGRRLNSGLERRNRARYVFGADITKEHADESIDLAETLLNILESKL